MKNISKNEAWADNEVKKALPKIWQVHNIEFCNLEELPILSREFVTDFARIGATKQFVAVKLTVTESSIFQVLLVPMCMPLGPFFSSSMRTIMRIKARPSFNT